MNDTEVDEIALRLLTPEDDRYDPSDALFSLANAHAHALTESPTLEYIESLGPIVIARNEFGKNFLGRIELSQLSEFSFDSLVKNPTRTRKDHGPVMINETTIEADYCAFLYEAFFPNENDDTTEYLRLLQLFELFNDPHALPDWGKKPGLFMFSSVFHNVLYDHPELNDPNHIDEMPHTELSPYILDTLTAAFTVYEEAQNSYVRQTGERFRALYDAHAIHLLVSSDPYRYLEEQGFSPNNTQLLPTAEAIAFVPTPSNEANLYEQGWLGSLLVPVDWLKTLKTHPNQALSYLLRAASLTRDHSYGLLEGEDWYPNAFGPPVAIPKFAASVRRAEDLMHILLNEIQAYDGTILNIPLRLDTFCSEKVRFSQNASHYDNPSQQSPNFEMNQ